MTGIIKSIDVDVNGGIWAVSQGGYIFTRTNEQWQQIYGMANDIATKGDFEGKTVEEIWVIPVEP